MCKNRKLFALIFFVLFTFLLLLSCTKTTPIQAPTTNDQNITSTVSATKDIFVYNNSGIARYVYDNDNKLISIRTLDPTTMSAFLVNPGAYVCEYVYSDNGYLSSLTYFGNTFTVSETDSEGKPIKAICETSDDDLHVKFSYGEDNKITCESFYESGELVLENQFDSENRPKSCKYTGMGKLTYSYLNNEVNVAIELEDRTQTAPNLALTMDENGYPKYMMQSIDSAIIGTTWTYNEQMVCESTLIESFYDGASYSEKYDIYYEGDLISYILYYVPNADKEPMLYSEELYTYHPSKELASKTNIVYGSDDVIDSKTINVYSDGKVSEITTETYTDGKLESKKIEEKEYDASGNESGIVTTKYNEKNEFVSKNAQQYVFDTNGNITERQTQILDSNGFLVNVLKEIYKYDSLGRRTEAEYYAYDSKNKLSEKEIDTFEYNDRGEITLQTVSMFDSTETLISLTKTLYEYDENGQVTSTKKTVSDREGNIIHEE